MNKIDEYTFYTILSFCQPYDLCKIRHLDKWSNKYVNVFLQKTIGALYLEEFACPSCGSFLNDERTSKKVINDGYFYDIQYESMDRVEYIKNNFNHYTPFNFFMPLIERCQLLCDTCDAEECDRMICGKMLFPRRGSRNYYLNTVYDSLRRKWAVLIQYDENTFIRWNEYKCFIIDEEEYEGYVGYEEYMNTTTNDDIYYLNF